ncbi:MAG: segregation/condensation protein A [Spirochaetales bacterium]|nr:segregation/condensation protein A [Spirochaetales bacterium]
MAGTTLWETKTDKYQVQVGEFDGPLDLLLQMVKSSEINIYDISISEITAKYLEYLHTLITMDLDNISEFVEMAATLVYIKSKTMLPVEINYEADEEDPREKLIERLLEYQKYKIAAKQFEDVDDEIVPIVRKKDDLMLFNINEDKDSNWKDLSVLDLITAFAQVLNTKSKEEHQMQIGKIEYTVEDKINVIFAKLETTDRFNFFEFIDNSMPKQEVICAFLALLELVKQGAISLKQHVIFGDIQIFKRDDYVRGESSEE